jgi:hypothetical protein
MIDWLRAVLVALVAMVGLWGLLVVLAARLPAGLLREVLLEAWPGDPRLLERLLGSPATQPTDSEAPIDAPDPI